MATAYVEVHLTPAEMMMAAQAGIMRHVENIKEDTDGTYGVFQPSNWQIHIEGALGEFALAKFLNLWWSGKGTRDAPDVDIYDARTADSDNKRLILHVRDKDERIVFFLTGINGSYKVRGWIKGEDGKKQKYWTDPNTGRPAFFVPVSDLNELSDFKKPA